MKNETEQRDENSNSEVARMAAAPARELRPEAKKVRAALLERGLETPMIPSDQSASAKKAALEERFSEILQILGLDLEDDSLKETPLRVSRMYVDEIFGGLDYLSFPKLTVIRNKMKVDEMVKVRNINVSSTCEHHFVRIDGFATVAYIPSDWVIGLSKINRIVRFFSQRPQVQERLTEQILLALQTLLGTKDVAVSITATHHCVKARGVMDGDSETSTTALGGVFKADPDTRKEFLMN